MSKGGKTLAKTPCEGLDWLYLARCGAHLPQAQEVFDKINKNRKYVDENIFTRLVGEFPQIFKSKKPQKSETELLLNECGEVLAKLKKKNLGEHEFLCELIKLMAFSIPQIPYEIWLEKCIESGDVEALNDLVFQYARNELLPGCEGGYDQCERLIHSFLALACGDMDGAKNVMTHSMPPSTNGYRIFVRDERSGFGAAVG